MAHAFFRNRPQAVLNGVAEGGRYPHVEAAADKSQAQRFGGQFGQFDTDSAENTFARLEDDAAGLELLLKGPALRVESVGVGAIDLRVVLEQALAR